MSSELALAELLERPILLISSAGTGKTTNLTEAYFKALKGLNFDPASILAITFTENAASEMRARICQKLAQELGSKGLYLSEELKVSTIDSFCAQEIREHGFLIGVSPDFVILDETEARLTQRRLLMNLLKVRIGGGRDASSLGEVQFSSYFSRFEFGKTLEGAILDLYAKLRAYGINDFSSLELVAYEADLNSASARLENAISLVLKAKPEEIGKSEKSQNALLHLQEVIRQHPIDLLRSREEAFYNLIEISNAFSLTGTKGFKELTYPLQEAINSCLSCIVSLSVPIVRDEVFDILVSLDASYKDEKRRLNALDFADLGNLFLKLLEEHPNLRSLYRERFKKIFVDEFQDLNPLQMRIIDAISDISSQYLVGDPKQSIYGFRYANPQGVIEKRRRFSQSNGMLLYLAKNFRSRPEILAFVNTLFELVEKDFSAGSETAAHPLGFEYMKLETGLTFRPKKEPSILIFYHPPRERQLPSSELIRLEAKQVAIHIKEVVSSKSILTSSETEEPRPLRFDDFAILLRRSNHLPTFESELTRLGIPFISETGKGFFDTVEIRAIYKFLEFLLTPSFDPFFAQVLRSDIIGISTESLYLLVSTAKEEKNSLFESTMENVHELPNLSDRLALEEFKFWHEALLAALHRMHPAEIVEAVITSSRLREKFAAFSPSPRAELNLEKLLNFANSVHGFGYEGVYNLKEKLRELSYQGGRIGQMWMAEEGFVRIMTVHSAKGLGFKAVVIADLNYEISGEDSPLLVVKEGLNGPFKLGVKTRLAAIGNSLLRGKGKVAEPGYDCVKDTFDRLQEEEELRLLYVALTRAVEHLVIAGVRVEEKSPARAPWRKILAKLLISDVAGKPGAEGKTQDAIVRPIPEFAGLVSALRIDEEVLSSHGPEISAPTWQESVKLAAETVSADAKAKALSILTESQKKPDISGYSAYAYGVSEFLRWKHSRSAAEYSSVLALTPAFTDAYTGEAALFSKDTRDFSLTVGNTLHKLLALGIERLPNRPAKDFVRELFSQSFLRALGDALVENAALVAKLRDLVESFAKSKVYEKLCQSDWTRTEYGFFVNFNETIFHGRIDLIFRFQEKLYLIDYKTHELESEDFESLASFYRDQLLFYTLAMKRLFPESELIPQILFLPSQVVTPLEFGEEEFDKLHDEVGLFIVNMRRFQQKSFSDRTFLLDGWKLARGSG